jgi:hypothetical protein
MPSRDPINRKANAWMVREGLYDPERRSAITQAEVTGTGSRTGRHGLSAQLQRLARRLGKDPDELAANIPADTLRRTKYPVLESVNPDGTRTFEHDVGVSDGPRSLIRR